MHVHAFLDSIPAIAVYVLTALVIMVESIGIPVPGEIMLVAAALLASGAHPHVSILGVAIAGTAGAVVGDSIGFAVGRKYGDRLFAMLQRRFPHHVNDKTIGFAKHEFARHGVWAVFFGRFVALLRIFAGPLAGSLRMNYPRFLAANALGGLCWAGGTAYAIHLVGDAAEKWLKDFSYVALVIAIIAAVAASTFMRRQMTARVDAYAAEREAAGEPVNPPDPA